MLHSIAAVQMTGLPEVPVYYVEDMTLGGRGFYRSPISFATLPLSGSPSRLPNAA